MPPCALDTPPLLPLCRYARCLLCRRARHDMPQRYELRLAMRLRHAADARHAMLSCRHDVADADAFRHYAMPLLRAKIHYADAAAPRAMIIYRRRYYLFCSRAALMLIFRRRCLMPFARAFFRYDIFAAAAMRLLDYATPRATLDADATSMPPPLIFA